MNKIITSPVAEFPGTIELDASPILPFVEDFMAARFMYMRVADKEIDGKTVSFFADIEGMTAVQRRERSDARFSSMIPLIKSWSIEGQPAIVKEWQDFNALPVWAGTALIKWLLDEIFVLCCGETEIPNASKPESTDTAKTPAATEGQPN